MEDLEQLKYPVGRFQKPSEYSKENRAAWIKIIEDLPMKLRNEVKDLSDAQLDTPYRPEGWTVRQTVHHIADSHFNAFIRFKMALTEDNPTIKPYFEDRFAKLPDTAEAPIESSLSILDGLHKRFVILLNTMTDDDYEKKYFHPEYKRDVVMKDNLALYSWHSNHHLAHITKLKQRMGW